MTRRRRQRGRRNRPKGDTINTADRFISLRRNYLHRCKVTGDSKGKKCICSPCSYKEVIGITVYRRNIIMI